MTRQVLIVADRKDSSFYIATVSLDNKYSQLIPDTFILVLLLLLLLLLSVLIVDSHPATSLSYLQANKLHFYSLPKSLLFP